MTRAVFLGLVLFVLSASDALGQDTESSASEPGQTYVQRIPGTDIGFTMAYVPGGSFLLGSPETEEGRDEDEGPQRQVTIEPFWMGIHEVTYDEYAILRYIDQDNDSTFVEGESFDPEIVARPSPPYEDPAHGMGEKGYPAVGMTQWGALQYARWLSEKTGKLYRLPTEAEWEYACRAGSESAYSFGDDVNDLDDYAWYYENSDEAFHPVGEKDPNTFGIFDLHGNVAEWTMDQYVADFYASLEENNEAGPWSRPTRLHPRSVRGGAFDDDPEALRCASRLKSNLDWKRRDPQLPKSFWWNTDSPFLGFRLVRPAREMTIQEIRDFWAQALDE